MTFGQNVKNWSSETRRYWEEYSKQWKLQMPRPNSRNMLDKLKIYKEDKCTGKGGPRDTGVGASCRDIAGG